MNALRETLDGVVAWARRRVGFSTASIMAYDPDVLLPVAFVTTEPRAPDSFVAACRIEQLIEPKDTFRELARRSVPVASSSYGEPATRTSPRWLELNEPSGRRHELRAALVDRRGRCWGAMNLWRDSRPAFSPGDVSAVVDAAPQLASRIARAMVSEPTAAVPAGAGTLWLDDAGEIVHASPNAGRWLDVLERMQPELPRSALVTAVGLRVLADPEASDTTMRVRTQAGWITVHAERLPATEGRTLGVSVVIDEAHPSRVMPLAIAAFDLTPREAEVTSLVLQGHDTRGVARDLHISEYTVQDHLKSVFTKVGVGSRRELAHTLALQVS